LKVLIDPEAVLAKWPGIVLSNPFAAHRFARVRLNCNVRRMSNLRTFNRKPATDFGFFKISTKIPFIGLEIPVREWNRFGKPATKPLVYECIHLDLNLSVAGWVHKGDRVISKKALKIGIPGFVAKRVKLKPPS